MEKIAIKKNGQKFTQELVVEKIRPGYDKGDHLFFTVNGTECSEFLTGHNLGRDYYWPNGEFDGCRLADDFNEVEVAEINAQLEKWIAEHKDDRFVRKSDDENIVTIEHGLNLSNGINVILTDEARLSLKLSARQTFDYKIFGNGDIAWRDRDYGDQYYKSIPDEKQEARASYMINRPEVALLQIIYRLEGLREVVHLDHYVRNGEF